MNPRRSIHKGGVGFLLAVLSIESPVIAADQVLMLGHVSPDSALMWFHDEAGAPPSPTISGDGNPSLAVRRVDRQISLLEASGLSPDSPWSVRCGAASLTFRTPPSHATTGHVVLAVGSCDEMTEAGGSNPVYAAIASTRPDAMLWLGDNWYLRGDNGSAHGQLPDGRLQKGEWTLPSRARERALFTRLHPSLRSLLTATAHYATWDDHDFGYNNAPLGDPPNLTQAQQDEAWFGRQAARTIFESMWANSPDRGPGISSTFRRGPVVVFLLDNRSFQNPDKGEIWGDEQLSWLKRNLRAAEDAGVPVKIVANGTQVLPPAQGEGHEKQAPVERERLLAWIGREQIGGVFFVTGDIHRSELWHFPDCSASLEFTCSPFYNIRPDEPGHASRQRRWVGTPVNNFGLITVEATDPDRVTLRLECRDAEGHLLPEVGGDGNGFCMSEYTVDRGRITPRQPSVRGDDPKVSTLPHAP